MEEQKQDGGTENMIVEQEAKNNIRQLKKEKGVEKNDLE